uniref:Secreted protein n=1 Tax=Steinernema glaseri TaxID=37863 RepID=A0A1I8AN91_9BILA
MKLFMLASRNISFVISFCSLLLCVILMTAAEVSSLTDFTTVWRRRYCLQNPKRARRLFSPSMSCLLALVEEALVEEATSAQTYQDAVIVRLRAAVNPALMCRTRLNPHHKRSDENVKLDIFSVAYMLLDSLLT